MKKNFLKLFVLFFVVLFIPLNISAKSMRGELKIADYNIKKDETLDVVLKVSGKSKEDINVFETVLSFDESVFEGIIESSFKTHNGWSDIVYNKETHAILLINKYGSTMNEDLVSFSVKLKDKVGPTTTSLSLKNTVISNSKDETELEGSSSTIKVSVPQNEIGNTSNEKKYLGKELIKYPAKRYNTLILIILELIIAIILVSIYFVSLDRLSNPKQRKFLLVGLILVEVLSISAMFTHDVMRGDLNGDNEINFEDVNVLAKHLVNSDVISLFNLAKADMNKDGVITTQDLAILLEKSSDKTKYEAKLTNIFTANSGYEKGTTMEMHFSADITDDVAVDYVMIDGKKYKAEKLKGSSNEYTVKLEGSSVSKKYNYKVTEVILENGKTIKTNYNASAIVLKDIPKLSSFVSKSNLEAGKVNVAFTVKDDDDAITSATYELVKSNGSIVSNGMITKGKNTLTLALENAVSYKLKIEINYDRGAESKDSKGVIEDAYDLKIITDYKLKLGTLALVQNGKVVENLNKEQAVSLEFVSTNVSPYNPKKVLINNIEYNVSKIDKNKYRVDLPNDAVFNTNSLTLSKVVLSNGKAILVNEKISYSLLKTNPKVLDIKVEESILEKKIISSLSIEDKDETISKLTVKLYDRNNEVIDEKVITDKNYDFELKTKTSRKYTIRVFADYSIFEGNADYTYKDIILYEKEFDAKLVAKVDSMEASELYPEKNSIVNLKYKISSNYDESVSKIIVNNVIYDVKKIEAETYVIEVDVGNESGVKEFDISKIILNNNLEYDVDGKIKIDVLKEKPIIDNFEIIENKNESKIDVSFDLFDKDEAFKSGKIKLVEKETGIVKNEDDVLLGKNGTSFVLENAIKYEIVVEIDGILDTLELNNESPNKLENYKVYSTEYRIVTDYKFDIVNIDTSNEERVTDYFNIADRINIEFNSVNVTEYYPIKVKINGITYGVNSLDGKSKFSIDGFDSPGVKNLKFESITLSNHVELVVNCTKKIEILKSVPTVESVELIDNTSEVIVSFEILDNHGVLKNLKALVLDEAGNEILNKTLENEKSFNFNKNDTSKYTIKLIGSYDLDSNTFNESDNEYNDVELFKREIDFNITKLQEIKDYDLELKEDKTIVQEINFDEFDLNLYSLKLTYKNEELVIYEIEKIKRVGDTVIFVLKNDEWINYQSGKWKSNLEIDYGTLRENILIKNSRD